MANHAYRYIKNNISKLMKRERHNENKTNNLFGWDGFIHSARARRLS